MTVPPKPPQGQDEAITAPASDKPTASASGTATAPASSERTAPASSRATTPMRARQWLWRALAVIVLIAAHEALVLLVAQGDLLARLVADRSVPWLLATALLYGVRLVVLLVLPGWLLWLAVATMVRRLHPDNLDG